MRIKLDENLGRPHVALLKRHGYDADREFDQGWSGVVDAGHWVHVKREGRFLITLDLGFSDVRRYAPGTHPGILLLRPRRKGRNAVSQVLRRVLAERRLETLVYRFIETYLLAMPCVMLTAWLENRLVPN